MATFPILGANGSNMSGTVGFHLASEHTYAVDFSTRAGSGQGSPLVAVADGTFYLFSAGQASCGTAPAGTD